MASSKPFAPFEWMLAWRYLRSKRADGGVSIMTWISLVGITLAVFALIATLAVRSGFRAEFVDTILGSNAHITVKTLGEIDPQTEKLDQTIRNYEERAAAVRKVDGVTRVAPLVRGQVMATAGGRNAGVAVYGISPENLATIPRVANPETAKGSIKDFGKGIAIGSGVASELGVGLGDKIRIISPDGAKTAFGTSPRVNAYEVTYIFTAGRYDIDRVRVYLPFEEAQIYFNREGRADELEVMVEDPEKVDAMGAAIRQAAGGNVFLWTWRDSSGAFLSALEIEDRVMFVLMSVLVLIAAMNITSGLIMLVRNKGRDIGILRTMGLTEGSILRVFFICGAFTGIIGTIFGTILGCLFAMYIDPIFALVNSLSGGDAWNPAVRNIYYLPAKLEFLDVLSAMGLSLFLSFVVTIFPAQRAARLNPVEALRYE